MLGSELEKLDAEITPCIESAINYIVLDLEAVPFIDSVSLEKIGDLATELGKRGGDLRISSLTDICADIFRATRMDSLVHCGDNVDMAVRSLG